MGRASLTSTLFVDLGFADVTACVYAESRDEEEEDLATAEIPYQSSSDISGFDKTSFDDDLAGDSIRQNNADGPSVGPRQPTRWKSGLDFASDD
jgi:hypothetical protein